MSTRIESFAQLRALRESLLRLPEVAARIAARGASLFSDRARQAFDAGVSVGGGDQFRGTRGAITLRKTGRLRDAALAYESIGTRIRASVGRVPYARYQLKHGILPKALPSAWGDALADIARDELARYMGGAR